MKTLGKTLIAAALVLLAATSLGAQNRHEVNLFVGGANSEFNRLDNQESIYNDLYALYEPTYSVTCSPTLTLDYHYALNSWFKLGVQANYCKLKSTRWYNMGNAPRTDYNKDIYSLLPQAKFVFTRGRHFRPYASVGVGIQLNGGLYEGAPVQFAWEVVPFGAEWGGNRIYGTAALCIGSIIQGGRIGVGFRF